LQGQGGVYFLQHDRMHVYIDMNYTYVELAASVANQRKDLNPHHTALSMWIKPLLCQVFIKQVSDFTVQQLKKKKYCTEV